MRPVHLPEIAERIERLPLSRWHLMVRLLIGTATLFDGFDQLLISYALPVLQRQWGFGQATATLLITAGAVGMLVGALLAGTLADTIGRIRAVVACIVLYSVPSLLMAFVDDPQTFMVLRFVQGVGIGGEVLAAAVYMSEIVGAARRGRFVLRYEVVFAAGLLCAALVSSWVIPAWGWRPLFVIGAAPVLLVFPLLRWVPESPRWLAARGSARTEAVMARIEAATAASAIVAPPESPAVEPEQAEPVARGRYARRTVVLAVVCLSAFLVNYALSSWMPAIYTGLFKVPLADALRYSLYSMVASFLGAGVLAIVVDRAGRRISLAVGLAGAGAALAVLALTGPRDGGLVAVFVTVSSLFISATNIGLYLYVPELCPTRARALGSSVAGVFIRLGVIVGPILVGVLSTGFTGFSVALGVLAAVGMLAAIVLIVFGEETTARRLEELSP
ncbi:MFS transporter [Kutzneria albida]|uniref:Major facilitator transporter n=1 Tax=Kutzneria albida DSM 43870 TaxID=1449976 RepID=W5W865_9PSEU|nr:MFS transporter [Kutzneria albida]AHH96711.1 major facilitator transporter [Kutzneria albida DSM 43870]